jgi:hypothetical protein
MDRGPEIQEYPERIEASERGLKLTELSPAIHYDLAGVESLDDELKDCTVDPTEYQAGIIFAKVLEEIKT